MKSLKILSQIKKIWLNLENILPSKNLGYTYIRSYQKPYKGIFK